MCDVTRFIFDVKLKSIWHSVSYDKLYWHTIDSVRIGVGGDSKKHICWQFIFVLRFGSLFRLFHSCFHPSIILQSVNIEIFASIYLHRSSIFCRRRRRRPRSTQYIYTNFIKLLKHFSHSHHWNMHFRRHSVGNLIMNNYLTQNFYFKLNVDVILCRLLHI